MRVAVDANVFISYLLGPGSAAAPSAVVRAALAGHFELIVPEEVILEIQEKIATKPDLAARITRAAVDELIALLEAGATIIRSTVEVPIHRARDAGDDFFLKSAVIDRSDVIVTGDKDLLAMANLVAPIWIATPADFVRIFGETA